MPLPNAKSSLNIWEKEIARALVLQSDDRMQRANKQAEKARYDPEETARRWLVLYLNLIRETKLI